MRRKGLRVVVTPRGVGSAVDQLWRADRSSRGYVIDEKGGFGTHTSSMMGRQPFSLCF